MAFDFVDRIESGLGSGSAVVCDHSYSFVWLANQKSLVHLHHLQHSVLLIAGVQSSRFPSDDDSEQLAGYMETFDTGHLYCVVVARERQSEHSLLSLEREGVG